MEAMAHARVVDLAQPLYAGMPCSPNHPGFRLALLRRHGDAVRADGVSGSNELIVTGGHVGTHVDALAHVAHDGMLYGGVPAADALAGGRYERLGIDELAPVVCRGVLLDVAGHHGEKRLPGGYGITSADLDAVTGRTGVEVGPGDAVLIRTGWAQLFENPDDFVGHDSGVPGPDESAAHWLAERRVRIVGSDTTAFEQIPSGHGHALMPVHRVLIVENGINIVEMLNLEELATAVDDPFCFVLTPLRILGGTGSPVRPIAILENA
jgi:kynurenine formamidase